MLRLFTPVAIVCDHTLTEQASALRGMLESFRLRVDFYRFVQKPQVFDFFGQPRNYAYTIIFCHGGGSTPEDMALRLDVVDQASGDYESEEDWDSVIVELTPKKIAEHVQNREGTLIAMSCGAGRQPLAEAFLKSGYRSYIGPTEGYVDTVSGLVFAVNFFYNLMTPERDYGRDYATTTYTEQEAVKEAAKLDPDFRYGPKLFRCYTKKEGT